MKRLAVAIVLLVGCPSPQQIRIERDLNEANAAERSGRYIDALQIYANWRGRTEDPKVEAQIEERRRVCADLALRQGEELEADHQLRRAIEHYKALRDVARDILGERLTQALTRVRQATCDQAVRDAHELEKVGRFRDAVGLYESVEEIAAEIGRGGELTAATHAARQSLFEADVLQARRFEEQRHWADAVRTLEELNRVAGKIGRAPELTDHLTRVRGLWVDAAVRDAAAHVQAKKWDQAVETYRSAQSAANAIGRQGEINRGVNEVMVLKALDEGSKFESQERWADAIGAYEGALGVSEGSSRETLSTRLVQARENRYSQALRTAEQAGDWSRAVAEYRSVETIAKAIGKSDDLRGRLDRALVNQAFDEALAHEKGGRWREAIARYEAIDSVAKGVGRDREVREKIESARAQHVQAQMRRAEELSGRQDYQAAIDALFEARDSAKGNAEFDDALLKTKKARFEQALDEGRSFRNKESYAEAAKAYASVREIARELGREDELAAQVRRLREEQYDAIVARARRLEQQEQWDEAVAQYERARGLNQDEALNRMIERALNGKIDALLAQGQVHERNERWDEAIRVYEAALPQARQLGREREVAKRLERVRDDREEVFEYQEREAVAMPGEVVGAEYDPTGAWMAAGDASGQVWIFETGQKCRCCHKLSVSGAVHALAFSPDGGLLAASCERTVVIWEVRTGRCVQTLEFADECHAVSFAPDGGAVLIGLGGGAIELWSWKRPRCVRQYRGHRSCVNWFGWYTDGNSFISVCEGGEIRIWTYGNGGCCRNWVAHTRGIRHVRFCPSGRYFATVGCDDWVYVWDAASYEVVTKVNVSRASACSFSGDRFVVISDESGCVSTWDIRSCRRVRTGTCHQGGAAWVTWHPGHRAFATCGRDRYVRFWSCGR